MFARAVLHAPDWLITDDATAALDDATARHIYEVLARRLPDATVLSITNRPSVAEYHQRRWVLQVEEHGTASLQT